LVKFLGILAQTHQAMGDGLDPEAYLADVIDRMAKGHPINRLAELLPWNWNRQAAKLAA
jgi:transposase